LKNAFVPSARKSIFNRGPIRSLTRVKIVRFGHFNLRVGRRLELSDRIAAFADDRAGSDARNQDFHVIHSI